MINISVVVKDIIEDDDVALQSLNTHTLNLSSYARLIQKDVENRAMKTVEIKSIIVALSRLAKMQKSIETKFSLKLQNLSVHSNLEELSYERTIETLARIPALLDLLPKNGQTFFTITQGITEFTIIADKTFIARTKNLFNNIQPFYEITDLSGITVKFDVAYVRTPKLIYELSRRLLVKRINIIEIISTTTELTLIIDKKDTQLAIAQLSKFLT